MTKSDGADENPSVLDLTSLRQLVGNDIPAIRAILDKFLSTAVESSVAIQRLVSEGNLPELLSACHRLKGAAGTVGALELRSIALGGETAAKSALNGSQVMVSSVGTAVHPIDLAIERLKSAVDNLV